MTKSTKRTEKLLLSEPPDLRSQGGSRLRRWESFLGLRSTPAGVDLEFLRGAHGRVIRSEEEDHTRDVVRLQPVR